ncbi:hypothetical protein [Sorangium sp. So ce1151]|uniref:hypothetical protein n=1 Tax=Sorangium sp. So ce1151 TaxID=3133332 RepID=UPI003F5E7E9B
MRTPSDVGGLSGEERRLAKRLETEIEDHFRDNPGGKYEFEPASIGAGEFSERVKKEVIARARKAGWIASELDDRGGFTVRRP